MDSLMLQVFQNELTCSICMNYFVNPVTIDCGHSVCRPCFYLTWQDRSGFAHCFECKGATQQRDFNTNVCLEKMALLTRKASLRQFLSSEDNRYGLHKKTKQIFCEDDRSLLCLCCSSSQEHKAHRHCSAEEAAEEHREKLLKKMHSLWDKCRENSINLIMETVTTRSWEGFGDILHRSEAVRLHMPQPENPTLTSGTITGMIERLNCFKVTIIPLYHEITNSHVFLHGGLIGLRVGCDLHGVPGISPQPECFLDWGAQTFTSGRYYWEIEMEDSWNWAFGVCNDDWEEKNRDVEKGLFLLGCVKTDPHYVVFTTSPFLLQYVARPIGQVGVFLDFEGRTVTFVNVAQSSLIRSITSCSFSPRLRPIICCSHF